VKITHAVLVAVVLLGTAGALSCKVDTAAFQARLFACDTGANDPLCGKDANGNPMTCFAARPIGGTDFCTESCGDTPMSLPDENAVCVQGGAKLKACDPTTDTPQAPAPGPCGNAQLGCLRTNVIPSAGVADEGVCVTEHPCLVDKDCRDTVKSTCAATFLQKLYAGAPAEKLHADHLYCLQQGCEKGNSSCSPGEACLPNFIPPAANPPDICVPYCGSNDECPPNFFCYRKNSGPANPPICIPGLLGFVCSSDVDCLMGTCVNDNDPDPGHGLSLCTSSCGRDEDCEIYDSLQGRFVCSADNRCITPEAYRGASCNTTADCSRDIGTICVWPPGTTDATSSQGTCLRPCNADRTCAPRGGIGQGCLPFVDATLAIRPVCYPGYFETPCRDQSACAVKELQCPGELSICTIVCTNDADCFGNRWTAGQAYCAGSFCVPLINDGAPCDLDSHCASGKCDPTGCHASVTSP
jgi:hypothetical protein